MLKWFCLFFTLASAQVFHIEIANTTVEYGSTDISVSCVVTNGSSLSTVFAISLKKSGSSVVSITSTPNEGISWQDTSLQNRNGVTANGSLSDVSKAYLHLYIPSSSVVYPDDEGTYQCTMSGLDLVNTPLTEDSESVFLNITGKSHGLWHRFPWNMLYFGKINSLFVVWNIITMYVKMFTIEN